MRYIIKITSMEPPRYLVIHAKPQRKQWGFGRVKAGWSITTIIYNATAFNYNKMMRFERSLVGRTRHETEVIPVPKDWKEQKRKFSEELESSLLKASCEGSQPVRRMLNIRFRLASLFKKKTS